MSTAPILTDGTVTLRAHRAEDAQGSWEQCQDPLSQSWTTVPIPYSMDDAHKYVGETMPRGWADDSDWGFAIEADGRYAGSVSLRNEGDGRAELAYGSHPWVRGSGYVERALRLLVEWGFAEQELDTIIWWANKGNWASRKVAWRLGFTFEGTLRRWLPQRGELRDAWVGTLLRDDPREPDSAWLVCPMLESDEDQAPTLAALRRGAGGRGLQRRADGVLDRRDAVPVLAARTRTTTSRPDRGPGHRGRRSAGPSPTGKATSSWPRWRCSTCNRGSPPSSATGPTPTPAGEA